MTGEEAGMRLFTFGLGMLAGLLAAAPPRKSLEDRALEAELGDEPRCFPPLAKPNPAAHGHMPGHGFDLFGRELPCCPEARAQAARCRASGGHGPRCPCPPLTAA